MSTVLYTSTVFNGIYQKKNNTGWGHFGAGPSWPTLNLPT